MAWTIGPSAISRRIGSSSAPVASHAAFPQAVRALASNMLALAERDHTLDGVFKDAGRYIAAMCAFHLHASGGPARRRA